MSFLAAVVTSPGITCRTRTVLSRMIYLATTSTGSHGLPTLTTMVSATLRALRPTT
ncbi:hypothetical protein F2Q69_00058829 [Brassica cretica]|uniref:Uncharacterized protein n=1 Tax=Brassica cretica TaxID=69181 RepID=A0A8S9RF58_BRACR|nr:hypothetical protein F2Q69_00058829 [Brassica cretica]